MVEINVDRNPSTIPHFFKSIKFLQNVSFLYNLSTEKYVDRKQSVAKF